VIGEIDRPGWGVDGSVSSSTRDLPEGIDVTATAESIKAFVAFWAYHGQSGSYLFIRGICTDKRARIDWRGQVRTGRFHGIAAHDR